MAAAIALPLGAGLVAAQPASTDAATTCIVISGAKFNAAGSDASNLNGEYVKIHNKCSSIINIKGWKVRDKAGNTYTFSSLRMGSGTVYLHTGKGKARAGHRYWGRSKQVWNNSGEKAYLYRADGSRASTWPRTSSSSTSKSCSATVRGFTADAVASARDRAGRRGTVCFPAGTYDGNLHASVYGQTWKLADRATINGAVVITGAKTKLINGTISRSSDNPWTASVEVRANDVKVSSVRFIGGGAGIVIYGKDRTRITWNVFRGMSGSSVAIWSEGVGADKTYIYKNSIVQTNTYQVSPITSRGNESNDQGGVQNRGAVIRNNTIDQGQGDRGWFGIELKQSRGTIVERNRIKGGRVLISLPETNKAVIRYNTLDLRGSADWGVEVANAHDTTVDRNKFVGDGPSGNDYGITINTGSQRLTVRHNRAKNIRTLVGIAGDYLKITDNCLTSVKYLHEWRQNGGSHVSIARNHPC